MIVVVCGAGAIRKNQTLVATIIGLTHRGMNADIRGDAGQNEILNSLLPQEHIEICRVKGTLPRLVNDRLAR